MPVPGGIPASLAALYGQGRYAGVMTALAEQAERVMAGRPEFFPEFTDHSFRHVGETLDTIEKLIPDDVRSAMPPILQEADGVCLVAAVILHDLGMHISKAGVLDLIRGEWNNPPAKSGFVTTDRPWHEEWGEFAREAVRYDDRTLLRLLGPDDFSDRDAISRLPKLADPSVRVEWSPAIIRAVGEFLRRHHPRLAHEIALAGFPHAGGAFPRLTADPPAGIGQSLADLAGFVARSHGLALRQAVEQVLKPEADSVRQHGAVSIYHMALLRIGDYLQIETNRAPAVLFNLREIQSPVSIQEWQKHAAVERIIWDLKHDPEAIKVRVDATKTPPHSLRTHLALRDLLRDVQREFDTSVTVLREHYAKAGNLSKLELSRRVVHTNLNDATVVENLPYQPQHTAFSTAGPELLRLLIRPLYGDRPEVGIRELMQNAVDAVREYNDLREHDARFASAADRESHYSKLERQRYDLGKHEDGRPIDVLISIDRGTDGRLWCTCTDRGVGMTPDVIRDYFLRAGASFRASGQWKERHESEDKSVRIARTGRFGIGAFAMFLLCDPGDPGSQIEVRTRGVGERRGVRFKAGLDTDPIAIEWDDAGCLGTQIRVPLDNAVASALATDLGDNLTDWYTFADPVVVRTREGAVLKQQHVLPAFDGALPRGWNRSVEDDFIVVWGWARVFGRRMPPSAVNGFLVSSFTWDSWPVRPPVFSILDRGSRCPITVQRDRYTCSLEKFLPSFSSAAMDDLLAAAMVFLPEHLSEWSDPVNWHHDESRSLRLVACADGLRYDGRRCLQGTCPRPMAVCRSWAESRGAVLNLFDSFDVVSDGFDNLPPHITLVWSADHQPFREWNDWTLVEAGGAQGPDWQVRARPGCPAPSPSDVELLRTAALSALSAEDSMVRTLAIVAAGTVIDYDGDIFHLAWLRNIGPRAIPWTLDERRDLIKNCSHEFRDRVTFWEQLKAEGWVPHYGWEDRPPPDELS